MVIPKVLQKTMLKRMHDYQFGGLKKNQEKGAQDRLALFMLAG